MLEMVHNHPSDQTTDGNVPPLCLNIFASSESQATHVYCLMQNIFPSLHEKKAQKQAPRLSLIIPTDSVIVPRGERGCSQAPSWAAKGSNRKAALRREWVVQEAGVCSRRTCSPRTIYNPIRYHSTFGASTS